MDGSEKDRQTEQQRQQRQARNRHVNGKDEAHGLAQIVVDAPAEADRLDDRTEVIVEQHDRRGFARHVRATAAHGDADMRRLERWRIVDAVAGHRHDLAIAPCSALTIRSFCSGMIRANTVVVFVRRATSASSSFASSSPVTTSPGSKPA